MVEILVEHHGLTLVVLEVIRMVKDTIIIFQTSIFENIGVLAVDLAAVISELKGLRDIQLVEFYGFECL